MQTANKTEKKSTSSSINLVDIFHYLLSYWYWFVLCIALCVGYAYYKYSKTSFTYRSDATVIIKDPSHAQTTVNMNNYGNMINKVTLSNEILQFRSKSLMTLVVKELNANVSYVYKDFLREIELYKDSPVEVEFLFNKDSTTYFSMGVTPVDEKTVRLSLDQEAGKAMKCNLGDTIDVRQGRFIVLPTAKYTKRYYGTRISVRKVAPRSAAVG